MTSGFSKGEPARSVSQVIGRATSFDDEVIRADLLRLAERCEELATRMVAAIQRNASRPIGELGKEPTKIATTPTCDVPTK